MAYLYRFNNYGCLNENNVFQKSAQKVPKKKAVPQKNITEQKSQILLSASSWTMYCGSKENVLKMVHRILVVKDTVFVKLI